MYTYGTTTIKRLKTEQSLGIESHYHLINYIRVVEAVIEWPLVWFIDNSVNPYLLWGLVTRYYWKFFGSVLNNFDTAPTVFAYVRPCRKLSSAFSTLLTHYPLFNPFDPTKNSASFMYVMSGGKRGGIKRVSFTAV